MEIPPTAAVGVVLGALFVAAIIVALYIGSARRWGRYATTSRRDIERVAREAMMGGTAEGYVAHGDLGPSPRDRLRSVQSPDDD